LEKNENLSYFLNEAKNIKTDNFEKKLKIAILGNSTVNGYEETIRVKCHQKKISCRTYNADYNQYNQEILKNDSKFYQFGPNITFLILDTRHVLGELFFSPYSLSESEKNVFIKNKVEEIINLIKSIINN